MERSVPGMIVSLLRVFHLQQLLLIAILAIPIVGSVRVAWELHLCFGPFAVVTNEALLVHLVPPHNAIRAE